MVNFFMLLIFSFIPKINTSKPKIIDGLSVQETMEMVALCNTFSFDPHFRDYSSALIPYGYRMIAQSEETKLLNTVRIFRKKNTLVFVFRGTVSQTNSWLENIHFMQIPASGIVAIEGQNFAYTFSENRKAAVHSGYVLATIFLWEKLQTEFENMNLSEINKIIFTGHSQGGALAQMFHAQLSKMENYKNKDLISYSFGSPLIGNQTFSNEFNEEFSEKNRAFRFINTADVVCKLPATNKTFEFNIQGINGAIDLERINQIFVTGLQFLPNSYKNKLDKSLEYSKSLAADIIRIQVGEVLFPEFNSNVFYGETGRVIRLDPQPYPVYFQEKPNEGNNPILAQLSKLQTEIRRELTFYQHSAFSYYNAIYEHYQAHHFRRMRLKELPEKML